jgi:hypothetical protein
MITFDYPHVTILHPKKEYVRREFSEIIGSIKCRDFEKLDKCNLIIEYNKKSTGTGKIYKRRYFTEDEMKYICIKIFNKYYLKNTEIMNWAFKEMAPNRYPQVNVKVIKL